MESLGINWKIFLGEIINFAILLYLLKRFVYKPLAERLESRRLKIEDGVKKSEEAEQILKLAESSKEITLSEAKKAAEGLVVKGEARAKEKAGEVLSQASQEKEKIIKKAFDEGKREIEKMRKNQQEITMEMGIAVAEKILKEKIDAQKDKNLIKTILSSLSYERGKDIS